MSDRDAAMHGAMAAIRDTAAAADSLVTDSFDNIWRVFETIRDIFKSGHRLFVCGNGGSAADAQHFVTELVVRLDAASKRRPLPAVALTTDTSILTAAANDFGFDNVFARQVEALAAEGDGLLLISTSGNSPNLLLAARKAVERGVKTLGLLGRGGGRLGPIVDCPVIVPSDNTQRIQEVHSLILHLWCEWLEPAFSQ
ncbi:MAG: D-sedoheptulose 7-phosphate isomerase [Candidatus Zixiibacteriota bacterium]